MQIITNNEMFKKAPSIFAQAPISGVSDKYSFIPTIATIEALRDEGYEVVAASQSKVRNADKFAFTKHLIRMRHGDTFGKELREVPELVIVNSHDKSSSFQVSAGIFRIACSNGLIVKSTDFGDFKVGHSGNVRKVLDNVIEGTARIIDTMPMILGQIDKFKMTMLEQPQMMQFAKDALVLRYGDAKATIQPEQLLGARRVEDEASDLWSVFNRVQENLMQGGLKARSRKTRPIKSVNEDSRINKALWSMASDLAVVH